MALKDWWKNLGTGGQLGAVGAGIGAVTNLAKGIIGAVQYRRGQKQLNNLLANPVTYKRPEEYYADLEAQKQRAGQTRMPGQGYVENNIGGAYSQAINDLERGSISSNTFNKGVGDLYQKTLNAYQDLGYQSAQWQDRQQQNLSAARQRGAAYSDMEWQNNVKEPWNIKVGMAADKMSAGGENLWGGVGGAVSNITDFFGTQYYADLMRQMRGGGYGATPQGNRSLPVASGNTPLTGLTNGIKVNWPSDLYRETDLTSYR